MYNKKVVFIAACLGMFLFGMVMISLGTFLPNIIDKYELTKMQAGTIASLLPFGILAGSLIFGPIVDRYGYKLLLLICASILMFSFQVLAYFESYELLLIAFFFIGFGGGILNGGTNALVSDISDESKSAKLSLLGVSFGIGALGMPIILSMLIAYYKFEYIISAIGIFIIFPILFLSIVSFPKPKIIQKVPLKNSLLLLKEKMLLLLGLILFFQSGIEGIINNWTTTYLIEVFEATQESALGILTIFIGALTLTRLALGFILKDSNTMKIFFICIIFGLTGFILLSYTENFLLLKSAVILIGIGLAPGFPVILGLVGNLYSEVSGTAFSLVLVIALLGNVIINYFTGFIAQSFGLNNFPLILLSTMLIMMFIIIYTNFQKRNKYSLR